MSATFEINDSVYARLLAESLPRPIRSDEDLRRQTALLLELDELDDPSPEQQALAEVLTLLIQDYEERRYPLPQVPPHESLRALMEDRGLHHKDIWPILGDMDATTEILAGRRAVSKAEALRLAAAFNVPVGIFL